MAMGQARCDGRVMRAVMELLEPKRLLSAVLGSDGTLTVEGTPGNDSILISRSSTDTSLIEVSVNRQVSSFPLASVRSMVIRAGEGNDRVALSERLGAIVVDVRVFAGSGNDRVQLGSGNDLVDAGAGNDFVEAGAGNDLVSGGEGNDRLVGVAGNDNLVGGLGNDRIDGGDGTDLLTGDAGHDVLLGGTGDDAMYGEDGNDLLDGGTGDDLLFGGESNDRLLGKDGSDDLFGEGGRDNCDGGNGDDYIVGGDDRDACKGGTGRDTFSGDDDQREWRDKGRGGSSDDICLTSNDLPQAVRAAISERFAVAEFVKIAAEDEAGDDVVTHYEILLRSEGRLFEVEVSVTGEIRKVEAEDCPPLTLEQLPEAVRAHYTTQYPGALLVKLEAEDEGGNGVVTGYEVKFTFGGKFYELHYAVDGRVLSLEIDGEDDHEDDHDDDDQDDD